jgi:histidyl-tRNA synthetase
VVDIIKERRKIDEKSACTQAQVYVANIKEESYDYSIKIASIFRDSGLRVSLNITDRDLRKQMEYANSMKFKFIAIIGLKEKELEKVTLRNLSTGEEKQIPIKDAIAIIKEFS